MLYPHIEKRYHHSVLLYPLATVPYHFYGKLYPLPACTTPSDDCTNSLYPLTSFFNALPPSPYIIKYLCGLYQRVLHAIFPVALCPLGKAQKKVVVQPKLTCGKVQTKVLCQLMARSCQTSCSVLSVRHFYVAPIPAPFCTRCDLFWRRF